MSIIPVPELERLLDANDGCLTAECRECSESECPCDVLRDVLFPADGTTDTLRALVNVAKAAEREVEDSEYEWHTPTGLIAALAPLVKEGTTK